MQAGRQGLGALVLGCGAGMVGLGCRGCAWLTVQGAGTYMLLLPRGADALCLCQDGEDT